MSRKVRMLPAARLEFDEAADWYERQRKGLGKSFVVQLKETLNRVAEDPQRHATVLDDARKVIVKGFPYAVIYRESGNAITVVAVFHSARNPGDWQRRVRPPDAF